MPQIPENIGVLDYIGILFLFLGIFFISAGIGVVKIEKVTVKPGKATLRIGTLLAVLGLLCLLPQIKSVVSSNVNPTPTAIVSIQTVASQNPSFSVPSLPSPTLEITWISENQVKVEWAKINLIDNLYLMTVVGKRYYAPIPISESSGERIVTVNSGITDIAIVVLKGVIPAIFPDNGIEQGSSGITIEAQIQKPIPNR